MATKAMEFVFSDEEITEEFQRWCKKNEPKKGKKEKKETGYIG